METEKRNRHEILPPAPVDRLSVEVRNGLVTLLDQENRPVFPDCSFGIKLTNGSRITTEGIALVQEILEDGRAVLRYPGDTSSPGFETFYRTDEYGIEIQLRVQNTTDQSLAVDTIELLVSPEGFRQTPADEVRVSEMGYQAQSPTHPPKRLAEHEFRPYTVKFPESQIGPMRKEDDTESAITPWMTRIVSTDGETALAGFISAKKYRGFFEFHPAGNGHFFQAVNDTEGIPLEPGKFLESEKLIILTGGDEQELLETYARKTADEMLATPYHGDIKMWGTWVLDHPANPTLTQNRFQRNVDAAVALNDRLGIQIIHVDDSPQRDIGDFRTTPAFPGGYEFLAQYPIEHGFASGLWLVPYVASDQTEVFMDHPDWFIQDYDNGPKLAKHHGGWKRNLYVLDPTHPEASEWMINEFNTLRDMGFTEVKADFIYLMSLEGERYDRTKTGIETFRLGMEHVREGFGDAKILGCQGPTLALVGLVDLNRNGHDINAIWDRGDGIAHSSLKHTILATQQSWYMNNVWWRNNPDSLIARRHNTHLTLPEIHSELSSILLGNGMLELGDDLTELEPESLEMIERIFRLQEKLDGMTARPMGPYSPDGLSEQMLMPRPNRDGVLFGSLSNWDDVQKELVFDPAEWRIPEGQQVLVIDHWSDSSWTTDKPFILPTPPHGTNLLSVQTA
jgi:hypothetical protein